MSNNDLDHSQSEIEQGLTRLQDKSAWRRRFSLALPAPLESAWREDHAKASLRLIQGSLALTFVFYTAYWATTQLGFAPPVDRQLLIIFSAFGVPGNAVLLAATFARNGWKYLRPITVIGVLFHIFGLYLFFTRAAEIGWNVSYGLVFLQVQFGLYALGLIWKDAVLLSCAALMVAPTAVRAGTLSESEALTSLFFIFAAAVVGCMGAYMSEHSRRIAWLREKLLTAIAERDTLTRLLNHGAFYTRAERVLMQARRVRAPLSMLILDIDHFKRINDEFGHPAGDAVLREVAQAIASEGRRPLDLTGRLGGEEFGLMLFDATPAQAIDRAEAVRHRVRSILRPDGRSVTVSIGVEHLHPSTETSLDNLIARADALLYRAKSSGRDRVVSGMLASAPTTIESPTTAIAR